MASQNISAATLQAGRPWHASIDAGVVIRVLLAAAAVLLCYQFQWQWLRSLTADLNLRLDSVAGVHLQRVASDAVTWRGEIYRYVIACTFADVWCGAIPLMWELRRPAARNLVRIAGLGVALVLFNALRLSFSDILFARGVPWWAAHEVIAGISYFVVWLWVLDHGGWRSLGRAETRAVEPR